MRCRYNFFILFLISNFVFSQLNTTNYTTADGLSNNAVRSLFIDANSDLWIGTENGVSTFKNGTFLNLELPKSIKNSSCWDITQDTTGCMWFASYGGGVYCFDGAKHTVFTTTNGLSSNNIRKLLSYKNKIFVGTELGVSIIDLKSKKIVVPLGIQPHFGVFIITDFFVYKSEVYFSAVNEGLYKIVYENGVAKIELVYKQSPIYSIGIQNNTLFLSSKGFINASNLNSLNDKVKKKQVFGKSIVWDYAENSKKELFSTAWGIFEKTGGLYKISYNIQQNVSNEYGITSKNLLNVVFNSKNNILYVGSKDNGIYEIRMDSSLKYNNFQDKQIIDFEKILGNIVVLKSNGVSFINVDNELIKNISSTEFKSFETNFVKKSKQKLPKHSDGYYELNYDTKAENIEYYEIIKNQKSFWIATSIGVFEMDFAGKIIHYVPIHSYKIGFTFDNKLIETIPYAGVRVYDDVYNLKCNHFSEFNKNTPKDVVDWIKINDKTYLVSLFDGLFVYQNKMFKKITELNVLNEQRLRFITKNENNNLIVATENEATYVIDPKNNYKIIEVIAKNSITGNTITFLENYKNNILIGTEKGINIFNNGTKKILDNEQGLKDCDIITSQIIENQLYLGTKKGFYNIDLEKFLSCKQSVKSLKISSIAINSIPIAASNFKWFVYNSKELVCDYLHNTIAIDIVPNGHLYPHKLQFRYRLKNTNNWSPFSDKPSVFLSYLPSETFHLEIEVLDLNTSKTTVFKLLKIIIKPPFWKTWWFICLLIGSVILIAVFIIYKSKKAAKKKAETDKIIAQSKLQVLLSQMNPHFTFNAMNAIQNYVFNKDRHTSSIFISKFASLMRQTLDNSFKSTITIEDEIIYLKDYIAIENMRFDNRINFEITVDNAIEDYCTVIPTMLLQPFVENIFVHAFDDTKVNPYFSINFRLIADNELHIIIQDNGNNFGQQPKTHQSKGISIATERIQIVQPENKNPIDIQFAATGTTVFIKWLL